MVRSGKSIILFLVSLVALTFIVLVLRPVPTPSAKNCDIVIGVVDNIWEGGGPGDIVFTIDENDKYYYINRGVEQGLSANALMEKLVGKEIAISYINQWTPLDPGGKSRHIAKVDWNDTTLYTEMD